MRLAAIILALMPFSAQALTLDFPGFASQIAGKENKGDSVFLPTNAFSEGKVEGITAEGAISHQSWRITSDVITTLQLLQPLRQQLSADGYEILFECQDQICGGFDFRFRLDVFSEPDMHVNLADFRYLVAQKIVDGIPEYASLVISRSPNAGFVQLTQVGKPGQVATITTSTKAPPADSTIIGPIGEQLEANGHATLDDLVFKPGSSSLGDGDYTSLRALADYLAASPNRTIMLVGHTDAEGALDGNVKLSRKRATSVMEFLITSFGVSENQVSADGVGFLSPRASNLTSDGRAQNRRVEVILTSTR